MYTVKEVAARVGMSEHTIRFYTDKGLIPAVRRGKNNVRLFDEEAVNWLTGVRYLKESGLPLDAVRRYVELCLEGDATIPARHEIIVRPREQARLQLEEARKKLAFLERKAAIYEETMQKNLPDSLNPALWAVASAG